MEQHAEHQRSVEPEIQSRTFVGLVGVLAFGPELNSIRNLEIRHLGSASLLHEARPRQPSHFRFYSSRVMVCPEILHLARQQGRLGVQPAFPFRIE
jgi:hypothetical protein